MPTIATQIPDASSNSLMAASLNGPQLQMPTVHILFHAHARRGAADRGETSPSCRSFCGSRNQISGIDSSGRRRCGILHARGQRSETTMRNPILPVAIAFVLVAPCTALAQSPSLNFQKIEREYKEQKTDGTARDPQSGFPPANACTSPSRSQRQSARHHLL
jgi:hypothetical protein